MDKFQPYILDTMFEKLFEEIHTAGGNRRAFPVNSNLNTTQLGSTKHTVPPPTLTDTEQPEPLLHNNENKYIQVLRKEYLCKIAPGSVTNSKQNDLVLSAGRNQRQNIRTNTKYSESNDIPGIVSPPAEQTEKQQTGSVYIGKTDQFITSADRKVSETINSDKITVEGERTDIALDGVKVVIHDHDTETCSDIHIHTCTNFEHAQNVACQEQLSGPYKSSNSNQFEFDRYKEQLNSSGEGKTLQICPNIYHSWYRSVNPSTDISSDAINVSTSSVNSSTHIESRLDQDFEESLNQRKQTCRELPQRQRSDNNNSRYILKANQLMEDSAQIIDLKPSTRRREFTIGKSTSTVSKNLDHQPGKYNTPMTQAMVDHDALEMNVTIQSECNKQRQDHILQQELCRVSTGNSFANIQVESISDLKPSFRRSVHKRSKEKYKMSTQINLTENNPSTNDTCRNQTDRSSNGHTKTARKNSHDVKSEEEKVQGLTSYHLHSLSENVTRPIRGCKTSNICKNTTEVLCKKERVMLTREERSIPVTFRSSGGRNSLSDYKQHNTDQTQDCSEQLLPAYSGELFKQPNKEIKSYLELDSCSKQSGQTTNEADGPGYSLGNIAPDSSSDIPARDLNRNASSVLSRNHRLEFQRTEKKILGDLLEIQCDMKKGTKRKRCDSFSNISEMSKCKQARVRNCESFVSNCVISGGQAKKKNKIKARNIVEKRKHFLHNGQGFIHKIHKTIAESSDLRSKIPGSENKDTIESEKVEVSELENIIPLDVLTCKNLRKARMRLEKQKGALHRNVSKDAIWRFVNSKY